MATARKPKGQLDAEKKIVELEKQLAQVTSHKDMYYKKNQEQDEIINGIHEVLDDLGVRGYRDDNKYHRVPLTVRLFAWAMQMTGKREKE
jgi:outer membrane protein assembly factor BamD (BamD/ComL family)